MRMTPNWLANQITGCFNTRYFSRVALLRSRNPRGTHRSVTAPSLDETFSILTFFFGCQTKGPESARQANLTPIVPTMTIGPALEHRLTAEESRSQQPVGFLTRQFEGGRHQAGDSRAYDLRTIRPSKHLIWNEPRFGRRPAFD